MFKLINCATLITASRFRRCESSEWERVAMWSEREGPRMDYEILQLRGQEKKFIDSM